MDASAQQTRVKHMMPIKPSTQEFKDAELHELKELSLLELH